MDLQKHVKEQKPEEASAVKASKKDESDYDDSFENYDDDEFEADDDKKDIKKSLKQENRKAVKFQAKNIMNSANKQNGSKPFLLPNKFEQPNLAQSRGSSRGSDRPEIKQEGGFAQNRKIVMNKRIISAAASNKQAERTAALREIVQIDFEEFDNQLNIKPQTKQDLYFNRLQTFQIQNEMIQSNDNNVEKEIQTEEIEEDDEQCQFPQDFENIFAVANKPASNKLTGFNDDTTVMELDKVENEMLRDLSNSKAKDKNPVEEKAKVSCPLDLLKVMK